MGWILFELATHPDELGRLCEEVCAARAADAFEDAGAINLDALPVLNAVIKANTTFLPAILCLKTCVFIGNSTIRVRCSTSFPRGGARRSCPSLGAGLLHVWQRYKRIAYTQGDTCHRIGRCLSPVPMSYTFGIF